MRYEIREVQPRPDLDWDGISKPRALKPRTLLNIGGAAILLLSSQGVKSAGATEAPGSTRASQGQPCSLDEALSQRYDLPPSPPTGPGPFLYFEVLNSCAKDGGKGHFDSDGTIDGYRMERLTSDYSYVDLMGNKQDFPAGTLVYWDDSAEK